VGASSVSTLLKPDSCNALLTEWNCFEFASAPLATFPLDSSTYFPPSSAFTFLMEDRIAHVNLLLSATKGLR